MFGFEAMAAFTHHVENAFDQVRKGQLAISPALIGVALAAQDHVRGMIAHPDGDHGGRGDALLGELAALLAPSPASGRADEPAAAMQRWRIGFRLARDAMALGNNPLMLLDELRGLGHCTVVALTDGVPDLAEIQPDGCYLGWDVVLTTSAPRSEIEGVFLFVADDAQLSIEPIALAEDVRLGEILAARGEVSQQVVEEVISHRPPIGEMLVEAGKVTPEAVKSALAEQTHIAQDNLQAAKQAKAADSSIRVPAERLDELMDRVGELVIAQARFKQLAAAGGDPQMRAMAEEMERLSSELRDTTMGIRMVPISSLFGRFRRLVHDLSRDLGKSVRLMTSGEETELDKTVIERLNDPLVHLVRNAIDHGLEPAAERLAAGKPGEGTVRLEAFQSGAQVVITVSEDGRGLDRTRIQAKAEENGLIAPGAKLSDDELFQLVFQAGFSTAKEVTSVSGRGVGMDVVKRGIEALRGSVDIANGPHGGACVTIRLPLTLAIIDGLLVRVGKGRFVIPLADVEECVELSVEADAQSKGRSFLNIRGDLVPFLRLREMFGTAQPPDRYQKVVVVSVSGRRVGLVVDQVIGEHQTVIKSLSRLHADIEAFSGATILGDGAVALILDVEHLVEYGQGQGHDDHLLAG